MKRLAICALLGICGLTLAAACARMQAQEASPVIQEFNRKARGTVQVTNISDVPKFVSCRAQGFEPDEHGAPHPHPLDAAMNVRIAAERVLLAPKSSRQVSFDATPVAPPAWFLVTCLFMPVERARGITVAMEVSSIVIVHGGAFDSRDVALCAKRVGAKVEMEVKNNGAGLARVDSGEVIGHRKQADIGTFILYPHQKRLAEADWKEAALPETVRIQIGKKRLEAPVN